MSFSLLRPTTVEPIFCLNMDIPRGPTAPRPYELCQAMTRSIGRLGVDGAQNIWGVWRLYTKTKQDRVDLLTNGLSVRGVRVPVYDKNPKATNTGDPDDLREKIIIKDLPLSVDNKMIYDHLQTHPSIQLFTDVRYSRERNEDGHLTEYRNGDRYAYAKMPILPVIPQSIKIGGFSCRVSHPTQKEICKVCGQRGHKALTENCPAFDGELNHKPFRSETMVESNFYPCKITYMGIPYHSSEQAFQHNRALDLCFFDIAESIMAAADAREAKKQGDKIPKDIRDKWDEEKGYDLMLNIAKKKAEEVEEFSKSLIETNAVYVEATFDKYWGSGLSAEQAACTKPSYWPGKNVMGAVLIEVAQQLKSQQTATPFKDKLMQNINGEKDSDDESANEGPENEEQGIETDEHFFDVGTDNELSDIEYKSETNTEDEWDDVSDENLVEAAEESKESGEKEENPLDETLNTTVIEAENNIEEENQKQSKLNATSDGSMKETKPKKQETKKGRAAKKLQGKPVSTLDPYLEKKRKALSPTELHQPEKTLKPNPDNKDDT